MKRFLMLAVLACLAFPAQADEQRTAGAVKEKDATQTFTYAGRDYDLHIPKNLPAGKAPLVIALHGGGGSKNHIRRNLGMDGVADKHGFVVAYLNGNPGARPIARNMRTWNGGGCCGNAQATNADDVSYIDGFIKEMIKARNIDPARVYITGHSNGGIMTYRFICERPGVVAAAAPIAGPLMVPECKPQKTPVLHIHGDQDGHVLVGGGYGPDSVVKANFTSVAATKKKLEETGATVEVKIVPGAGHSLSSLNEILLKTESKKLAEVIASFFDRKTL